MDSILTSIKKLNGMTEEYDAFDPDIIMYVNSVFFNLKQLGVGPTEGFTITDSNATWDDFIADKTSLREATKTYMAAKVRLQFDPPTAGSAMDALNRIISEYEWRLNVEAETP